LDSGEASRLTGGLHDPALLGDGIDLCRFFGGAAMKGLRGWGFFS
jgi:hypothetical protein